MKLTINFGGISAVINGDNLDITISNTGAVTVATPDIAQVAQEVESAGVGAVRSVPASDGADHDTDQIAAAISRYLADPTPAEKQGAAWSKISFDRVREFINTGYTDDMLRDTVDDNYDTFRPARLKGGKLGLALIG